jgi:uncharacterized membrane protein
VSGDEGSAEHPANLPVARLKRVDAVDCARGVALIGMAIYHLSWDLADFGLAPPMLPFMAPMRLLSHIVASAFLATVGVSAALAHRDGIRWPAFWRRIVKIAAAAALVTAASLIFAPGAGIYFGILHCIVVASLIAAPFTAAPPWASLVAGAAVIAAPLFLRSPLFDPPALVWLGLGDAAPDTLDWRPLLPWGGVVLIGLGIARLPAVMAALTSPGRWRAASPPSRTLCLAGRHSLAVYLVHQPVLIGVVYALTAWGGLAHKADMSGFLSSCQSACVAGGSAASICESSCRCVADVIARSGEADRLSTLDETRKAELKRYVDACKAP